MKLTPEALFGPVPLTGPVPSKVKIAPGGGTVAYLLPAEDDRQRLDLWLTDLGTGNARLLAGGGATGELTDEEKAERERRRQFTGGVAGYQWHPDGRRVLVHRDGGAVLVSADDGATQAVTPPGTRQTGIRLSPKGTFASYVRGGDLYVARIDDGSERRLTHDSKSTVSNGLPDFIAQEEMHRFDGHWWSPDEGRIAFLRVDAAPIPETHRHEIRAGGIDVVPQRYPFAGGPNAEVRLGVLDLAGGDVDWLQWAVEEGDYLARVAFAPDGALYVQAQSRHQRRLALRRFDDAGWSTVLTETSDTWINLHDNLTFVDGGKRLLWTSERGGTAQLYEHRLGGGEGRLLDLGLGRVNRVLGATAERAWVTGWQSDPTTQDVFEVALDTCACSALTRGDGWYDGVVDARTGTLVLTRADAQTPGAAVAHDGVRIAGSSIAAGHPYIPYLEEHAPCEVVSIENAGETLYYRLTKPSPFVPTQRYPVVVHVYGGPGVQRVRRDFPPLMLQLFAQAGFAVFELDNRGGANRSKAFEDAIHGQFGRVEVDDQLAGVAFLRTLPWVDAERIAIFGHSYGGYMVLKCLAGSDVYRAGVSVAPCTRWELYDTHYTERYLGMPQANADGYRKSGVLFEAASISAPLLLMHGMADDNVLFTHSTELMHELQSAGVAFDLMTYPGSKHALQEPAVAIHRYRHMLDFLRRHLLG